MTLECPKCKSPVAREGQRFCYRCGHELNAYYDSLKMNVADLQPSASSKPGDGGSDTNEPAPPPTPKIPSSTVVLDANAFDAPAAEPQKATPKAALKILLPTGDVFDRELSDTETQIGKGPRNDIVIADPAVSSAHATIRVENGGYTISDIGSRNGTVVNGERVEGSRALKHGDVIGVGLSKLTFRLTGYSETGAMPAAQIVAAKPAEPPPLTQDSLATVVVEAGLAKKSDVDRLRGDGSARRLYAALVEEQIASEEALRDLMSRTFQLQTIDLHTFKLDKAAAAEFPAKLARAHGVFACAKDGEAVVLAVADPTDTAAVELAKHELRDAIDVRLATASQIREQIDRHYAPRLIGV